MRYVFEHREEAKTIGCKARTDLLGRYNLQEVARSVVREMDKHQHLFKWTGKVGRRVNILLEGIFYNGHGLAEGNRMLLKILVRAGYRVRIKVRDPPDKYTVLHPKEIAISSFENKRLASNDIYIYNWVGSFVRYNSDFRINIARTTFETDRIPASWVPKLNKFDEVRVQSKFNLTTFTSSGIKVPMRLIPNFFDFSQFSPEGPALSLPVPESFKFLSVFDVKKRKGYDLLLNAFLSEFSNADHVTLIIKVRDSTQTEIIEQFIRTHPKPKRKRPHNESVRISRSSAIQNFCEKVRVLRITFIHRIR